MKDCIRFAPLIGAREGELTPGEAKTLAAHLDACGRCRADAADAAATAGLVSEALLARANARDFSTFVDEVMEKVGDAPERHGGFLSWLAGHRRAATAALAPVLAAAAVLVYVRVGGGGRDEVALLELASEGNVTMVLQTSDGPVVLLADEEGS